MTFSPEWLFLREPVDHRSRNEVVAAAVRDHFAAHDRVNVVDLGAGTGANLRFTRRLLPRRQHWLLVDGDQRLLDRSGAGQEDASGQDLTSATLCTDLSRGLDRAAEDAALDLVTASALFDLVSADWIDHVSDWVARRRLPVYASLTYDGRESWLPAHPDDAQVHQFFLSDQRRDKGFGPAMGPEAWHYLSECLEARGYRVVFGRSDWMLDAGDRALIAALADAVARPMIETGEEQAELASRWAWERREADSCIIGHVDLFAYPL